MNYQSQGGSKQPLDFRIIDVSSEDPECPSVGLLNSTTSSKGWQTKRFAIFPQHLLIQFFSPVKIHSLQLLSHQCKIASKVDIFSFHDEHGGQMSSMNPTNLPFLKLGYFPLSPNEESGFQARELKTVYLNTSSQFMKIVFHKPHINSLNVFNQVGVVGLTITGETLQGNGGGLTGNSSFINTNNRPSLRMQVQYDPKTREELEKYEQMKNLAIKNEDYAAAKQIKQNIDFIKKYSEQLFKLEQRKKIAIDNEDYDAAMALKNEIQKLRSRKMEASNIQPQKGYNKPPQEYDNQYRSYQNYEGYDQNNYNSVQPRNFDNQPRHRRTTFDESNRGDPNTFDNRRYDERMDDRRDDRFDNRKKDMRDERMDDRYNDRRDERMDDRYDDRRDNRYDDRKDDRYDERRNDRDPSPPPQDEFSKRKEPEEDFDDPREKMKGRRNPRRNRRNPRSTRKPKSPSPSPEEEKSFNSNGRPDDDEPEGNMIVKRPVYEGKNDFDEMKIPALGDKKQPQMSEFPDEEDNQKEVNSDPVVSKKNQAVLNTFLHSFEKDFLKFGFSNLMPHRLKAISTLSKELSHISKGAKRLPTDTILEGHVEDAIISSWKLNNIFFEDRVPKIVTPSLQIFEKLLVVGKKEAVDLNSATDFTKELSKTILTILNKISDYKNNLFMNKLYGMIMAMVQNKAISLPEMLDQLVKTKGVPKKLLIYKHFMGRNIILRKIVRKQNIKDHPTLEQILTFCASSLQSTNGEVRVATMKLILTISRIMGDAKVIANLEKLKVRKNNLAKLKEELEDKEDESSDESQLENKPEEFSDDEPIKKQRSVEKRPKSRVRKQKPPVEESEEEEEEVNNDEGERHDQCDFCKISNKNFTFKDQYDMHLYKECPMLVHCKLCKQATEISYYTEHLLTECGKKDSFTKCPRCKMALSNKRFSAHTKMKKCKPMNEDGRTFVCPLCKEILTGERGEEDEIWRNHLVRRGCENNLRTNA